MLKHRTIVVGALLVLITLIGVSAPAYTYFILAFIFLVLQFYGASYIQSEFHLQAFCRSRTAEKVVAITFDDGPGISTENVLNVLKEENAKAGFFLIGKNIEGNELLLKRMQAEGHTIGNHSYTHNFWYDLNTATQFYRDLKQAEEQIERVIGTRPLYFRPPYGVTTPALARAVKKLNYHTIGWNIRSFDTKLKDPRKVMERIKERLQPGSIILLHDSMRGAEHVLTDLLQYLKKENYKIVGLEELSQQRAYA
ncbi:MAG: polysaccharide deacetylase family protein [bacterium]|nr:polysaccharide deacetylase family protein [bacterium]